MNYFQWSSIESIDPKTISSNEINQIFEIEQDMWAYWIWEFVQCVCCQKMHSKQDIFGYLNKEIQELTVSKILSLLSIDNIACKVCKWNTKFIYDTDYKVEIQKRYNDYESYLTLFRNEKWDIKWFIDWYVWTLEEIYNNELECHYKEIGFISIQDKVSQILWSSIPKKIFSFSSMWTEQSYMNFPLIFELLRKFINSIPENNNQILWLTELDKWWNLDRIYKQMWSKDLWFSESEKIVNKNTSYNSDIFIIPNSIQVYKEHFSYNIREFLQKHKEALRDIA